MAQVTLASLNTRLTRVEAKLNALTKRLDEHESLMPHARKLVAVNRQAGRGTIIYPVEEAGK